MVVTLREAVRDFLWSGTDGLFLTKSQSFPATMPPALFVLPEEARAFRGSGPSRLVRLTRGPLSSADFFLAALGNLCKTLGRSPRRAGTLRTALAAPGLPPGGDHGQSPTRG